MAPFVLLAGSGNGHRELTQLVAEQGYEVRACALEDLGPALRERLPDLLVLLADLPDAVPLLRQLKAQEDTRDLPLMMALPTYSALAAARVLEAGADEFLLPPFQPQEVLARLAVLLRLKEDRALLLSSRAETDRLFQEMPQPLFQCGGASGEQCILNPSLRKMLGYPRHGSGSLVLNIDELLYTPEDEERFSQFMQHPTLGQHVKVKLRHRDGQPVAVLLELPAAEASATEQQRIQVHPVGAASPLKKALRGLVDHLLPTARDYLTLLQLTPLLGGRYEKVRKLGQGSFGEVWLILDTEVIGPQRHFVAKIPFSREANTKFRKEAAICQRLAPHPGVVGLVGTLEEDGRLILIQEYVEGRTLGDMLGEELPRPLVERIVLQLIEVVAHAHRLRVMHRDIKPNNIIIRPDGLLKLLDFGSAKILREKDISATMVGSRPFMAPEQIMGKSERRSDIWAIGVLMYLLYTGELPFYSEVEKLLIDQILEQEPRPPREENSEIPPALEAVILRCLKKPVEERYPQALALREDLLRHFPHYGTRTGRWPWTQ